MGFIRVIYRYDKKYPKSFWTLDDVPSKIYAEGNVELLNKISISIVGSRKCTNYGEKMSRKFAKEFASLGIVTVSGLAIGVDSFVHKETLNCGGETIAVLPSGLKRIYPKENIKLYKNIINNGGLVISEYEPEEIADSKKFIQRNRLISALGECLIVTEAAYRSGTSITARLAREQGKKVFCVPSALDNRCGIGTNKMIKNGAYLLSGISDVFEELDNEKIKHYRTKYIQNKKENGTNKEIPIDCKEVYEVIHDTATSIDYIFNKTNENIADISYKLTVLELEGFIKFVSGGFYERCY